MKNYKKINLLLVSATLLLSACSNKVENEENKENKNNNFVEKTTKYKKDNTTEVLIDKELKKDDIVRSYKHGDHWHVFTKDGKEHIVYTDPEKLGQGQSLSLVSVVDKNKLSGLNVVSIKQHGDHWHVYTANGQEYLTYENPAALFPHVAVGTYTGSHDSNGNGSNGFVANNGGNSISSNEVVRILKHGDHYHIYTRSGEEFISYVNPSAQYPNIPIGTYTGTHGDSDSHSHESHDHVENNYENDVYGSYKPNYLNNTSNNLSVVQVLGKDKVNKNDIVRIAKHGDHYHIYDSNGNEGITYTDPAKYYPNVKIDSYVGSHGGTSGQDNHSNHNDAVHNHNNNHNHVDNHVEIGTNVPNNKQKVDIVRIAKHGDHYHLYTSDGEEIISYKDPSKLYPNVKIENYEGHHGDETSNNSNNNADKDEVVRITKHGDHYHLITKSGKEILSSTDPSKKYPNIPIEERGTHEHEGHDHEHEGTHEHEGHDHEHEGTHEHEGHDHEYEGTHEHEGHDHEHEGTHEHEGHDHEHEGIHEHEGHVHDHEGTHEHEGHDHEHEGTHEHEGHDHDHEGTHEHEGHDHDNDDDSVTEVEKELSTESDVNSIDRSDLKIISVLGEKKLNKDGVVRIGKHGDHYHLYDSNGNEGITYTDPSKYYPNVKIGNYEGTHGEEATPLTEIVWPEGITKIIDHGDHWHLLRGDEEVTVVSVDPKPKYPNAEVIKEEVETGEKVDSSELFSYGEISPNFIPSVLPYLSENIKAMTHFGSLVNARQAVFGSNQIRENIFYWLHGDHYHAITIPQLIAKEKAGEFGNNTARDVVAVLKYKFKYPETSLDVVAKVDADEVHKFLMNYYNFGDNRDVEILGNNVTVYRNNENRVLNLTKFDKVDGKVVYSEPLPVLPEKPTTNEVANNDKEKEDNLALINKLTGSFGDTTKDDESSEVESESVVSGESSSENIASPTVSKETPSYIKETPDLPRAPKVDLDNIAEKEQAIYNQIASVLNISVDQVEDLLFDVISEGSFSDIVVNNDGTITLNGKTYDLKPEVEKLIFDSENDFEDEEEE